MPFRVRLAESIYVDARVKSGVKKVFVINNGPLSNVPEP